MKVKQFWVLHFYIEKKLFIWPSLRQQRAARQEECLAILGAEISGDEVLIQIVKEITAAIDVTFNNRME